MDNYLTSSNCVQKTSLDVYPTLAVTSVGPLAPYSMINIAIYHAVLHSHHALITETAPVTATFSNGTTYAQASMDLYELLLLSMISPSFVNIQDRTQLETMSLLWTTIRCRFIV
jgi:hypothetical protein